MYLVNSNQYFCGLVWGVTPGPLGVLDIFDGTNTYNFSNNVSDTYCTVSLAPPVESTTDPTAVTVTLNYTFSANMAPGSYSIMANVFDVTGDSDPAGLVTVGTWTINAPPFTISTPGLTEGEFLNYLYVTTGGAAVSGTATLTVSELPSWLTFQFPSTLSLSASSTTPIALVVGSNSAVTPGAYSGTLTLTIGGASQTIPVSVTVPPSGNTTGTPSGSSYAYADGLPTAQFTYKLSNSLGYSVNSLYLSGCTVSGSGVSASVTTDPGTAFFYVSYTAASTSQPGTYSVTCTYLGMSIEGSTLQVYDATPTITGIIPNPISESFLPQSVAFVGYGFGAAPPTLTISPSLPYTILPGNSPTYFAAQILAPAAGRYSISVTSTGNNSALGFQAGGSPPSAPRGGPTVLTVTAVKPVIQGLETQTGVPSNPGPNAPVDAQSQGFLELFGVGFTNAGAVATPLVKITRPSGTAWTCGATQVAGSPCWLEYISDTQINVQYTFSTSPVIVGNYGITVTTGCNGASCGTSSVWNFLVVPAVLFNGTDVTGISSSVVDGQQIALSTVAPLAAGVTIQSQQWTVPGTTVGGFPGPNPTVSGGTLPTNFTQAANTFYWLDASAVPRQVNYELTLNTGPVLSSGALFDVAGPTSPSMIPSLGLVAAWGTINGVAYNSLNLGCPPTPGSDPPQSACPPGVISGIKFTASTNNPAGIAGTLSFVQFISNITDVSVQVDGKTSTCTTPGVNAIDTYYPYATGSQTTDNPGVPNLNSRGFTEVSESFAAQMYAMWTPNLAAAIPVPLGSIQWNYAGDAIYSNASGTWILNPNSAVRNSAGNANAGTSSLFQASISYPQPWNSNIATVDQGAPACSIQ